METLSKHKSILLLIKYFPKFSMCLWLLPGPIFFHNDCKMIISQIHHSFHIYQLALSILCKEKNSFAPLCLSTFHQYGLMNYSFQYFIINHYPPHHSQLCFVQIWLVVTPQLGSYMLLTSSHHFFKRPSLLFGLSMYSRLL